MTEVSDTLPAYTPSREAIQNYGMESSPEEGNDAFRARQEENRKIEKEAARRFDKTLTFIEAKEFLLTDTSIRSDSPKPITTNEGTYYSSHRKLQNIAIRADDEAHGFSLDTRDPYDVAEKEKRIDTQLEDYRVKNFLQQAVGLRIFANRQLREHITSLYPSIHPTELPDVIYIDRSEVKRWERKLGLENMRGTKYREGGFLITGTYGGVEIPGNICYIVVDERKPLIDQADVLFEELYHASGALLMQQPTNAEQQWPGRDGKTGHLLEEGLTKYDKFDFFMTNYHDEYLAPGTLNSNLLSYLKGEEIPTTAETSNFWPMFLMDQLLKKCGGKEFVTSFRQARANNIDALNLVRQTVDTNVGSGIYEYLSKIDDNDIKKIKEAIRKINGTAQPVEDLYRVSDATEALNQLFSS